MKYLFVSKPVLEWTTEEQNIIAEAVALVHEPPAQDIFIKVGTFLSRVTNADYVTIGITVSDDKKNIKALAYIHQQKPLENMVYSTFGAPCENVLGHNFCFYPRNIQQLFPKDDYLKVFNLESYMGIPLNDREDNTIGLLSLLHSSKLENPNLAEHLLNMMASFLEEVLEDTEMALWFR